MTWNRTITRILDQLRSRTSTVSFESATEGRRKSRWPVSFLLSCHLFSVRIFISAMPSESPEIFVWRHRTYSDLLRRPGWLPFKDEVNLQQWSLTFIRRMRNEDDRTDYITKLLPRSSDLRVSRASRYGRFNLVCPFYNREKEGGVL